MGKKGNGLKWISFAVIAAVLALGVYAVWGTLSTNVASNKAEETTSRIQNGTATVEELADMNGKTVDELLATYEIAEDAGIDGDSSMMELADKMTLKKYCEFFGLTYTDEDFAEYKAEQKLGDDVTVDTVDTEIKSGFATYVMDKQNAAQATADSATEADASTAEEE